MKKLIADNWQLLYHDPMGHVVYGTAGHIDHGKTALVKALTGTDCDRLPEERERGITIDLGFAALKHEGGDLHFVDVPGHERLVHTMIAGAAGIDLALLVVAADEGVMPQTREHLEVIRLMGVAGGAVALTKIDLVDEETQDFAVEEVKEILQGTAFEGVPIVGVSAHTGAGLDNLREILVQQSLNVRPHQIEDRPFREAVDRVFSLSGAGTVVTGTSLWGRLKVGDPVVLMPSNREARARRLHVHSEERDIVEAGERVALNLAGLGKGDCPRGTQILTPGPWRATQLVTIRLELLEGATGPLDEGDQVEVHAQAMRTPARIDRLASRPLKPGSSTVAQILLRQEMMLFPGDRLVLRRPSPVNTFAGGQVLDTRLRLFRRGQAARLADVGSVHREDWPKLFERWIIDAGLVAPSLDDLAGRLGVLNDGAQGILGRLLANKSIKTLATTPPRFISEDVLGRLAEKAKSELKNRLAGQEVSSGVPARDFVASLVPPPALPLSPQFLEELRLRGIIEVVEGRVLPPGRSSHMTQSGAELTGRVDDFYKKAGFEAPAPKDAAQRLEARPAMVEGVCRFLVQQGSLVRLDNKWFIHRQTLDSVVDGIGKWEVEDFAVGEFKERFGLTRKLAIPLLEWLDSNRVTVRAGNRRKVLRRRK